MNFARRILLWHEQNARRDLPWQHPATAYRVWVSEIMLQQTQVATVADYFPAFMARFPTVGHLAAAEPDDVLALWSGLGYYARARNLHKAARIIHRDYGDRFPDTFQAVSALPGIGRSTAGAILALAFGQRHPILDGNVKRVLARHHAIEGWPGESAVSKRLWALAEAHTPHRRVAEYTQAMMDLGATLCTRTRPACPHCPVGETCLAHARGEQPRFPAKRPQKPRPIRATTFVLVSRAEDTPNGPRRFLLLEKRPPTGIWGGLWGFPECPPEEDMDAWCVARFGAGPTAVEHLPPFRHTFTHFHLDIRPVLVDWGGRGGESAPGHGQGDQEQGDPEKGVDEKGAHEKDHEKAPPPPALRSEEKPMAHDRQTLWYPLDPDAPMDAPALGLAAPVVKLLGMLGGGGGP
uniref:Adenine DNA glycosylase n=1 Tax=Candidatus Kentrum eta TaxID=2126337 RepID=A0A450UQN4_9GAMM|nr:MAG: A/G-specific DNA-adenine glycosylase [Candidatus Kentron sp. H]VFJ94874.1 MAG: A/G-specific DNA-adenine glycosylase [Candidatus Kentron sp. H]VFK01376.1 MAG: A/G-specific DNA-adenine glycosylase [Candidatus Kentron sp. H]